MDRLSSEDLKEEKAEWPQIQLYQLSCMSTLLPLGNRDGPIVSLTKGEALPLFENPQSGQYCSESKVHLSVF
jgi:hypothetical protein